MKTLLPICAPKKYWDASAAYLEEVCNGCGAKGGIKVPNSFLGLSIKTPCNIHDVMFKEGKTQADFLFANAIFLLNLTITIINGSNWFMKPIRFWLATKYFIAVSLKGKSAYWKNKKINTGMYITYKGEFR